MAVNGTVPVIDFGTLHAHDHGDVVSVHRVTPFTEKTTFATRTLSDADAAIVTLDPRRTLAPLLGDVILTVGASVSPGGGASAVTVADDALAVWVASPANDAVIDAVPALDGVKVTAHRDAEPETAASAQLVAESVPLPEADHATSPEGADAVPGVTSDTVATHVAEPGRTTVPPHETEAADARAATSIVVSAALARWVAVPA